jgi:DNA processing protein
MNDSLSYTIAFSNILGMNDLQRKILLEVYGSAENIFKERFNISSPFQHLHPSISALLMKDWPLEEAEKEILFAAQNGIHIVNVTEENYPRRLAQCEDAPTILYIKGNMHFQKKYLVSIVGTRQSTFQSKKIIHELIEGLAHLNIGIISGMALGVDGMAHQSALDTQIPTWGVLAHGLDQIYPPQHRRLAIDMMSQGGLITENKKNTKPLPYFFPKRNRIVAGMSDATIVIESDVKGGSMITAHLAAGYHRSVFAVPGKLTDTQSKGCLQLIKNNVAQMYYDAPHFLECMQWELPLPVKTTTSNPLTLLFDPLAITILKMIEQKGPIHPDQLSYNLKLSSGELSTHLMNLEIQEMIHKQAGNTYIRL